MNSINSILRAAYRIKTVCFFFLLSPCVFATNYPLSIEHRFGTSVIPAEPKRVATVDWGGADNLLALGVQPLTSRYWFGGYENGIWPWASSKLSSDVEVLRGELDFEQIASTKPDIIMAIRSGISKEDYRQLSKIAPVIAVPKGEGDFTLTWSERARMLGRILNREDQAESLINDIEQRFRAVQTDHPSWSKKHIAMATYWDGNIGVYSAEDVTVNLTTRLGLSVAEEVKKLTKEGQFYMNISEEMINVLDADILVWFVGKGAKQKIESLKLRPYLGVYKQGREIFLPTTSISNGALSHGSLLSLPTAIDHIVPLLEAAIDGNPQTPIPEVR